MAPSQPSDKVIEGELRRATREIFYSNERAALSVNLVRKRAQDNFDLADDFFLSDSWKTKSKTIVKQLVVRFPDGPVSSRTCGGRDTPRILKEIHG